MALPSEMFQHSPEEIAAGKLLHQPPFEHRSAVEIIIPELESHLKDNGIPHGGIPKEHAKDFSCGSELQEVISYGLFDPKLQFTSERQRQTEGKVIADTAAAIIIGKMMDNIFHQRFQQADCLMSTIRLQMRTLRIPDNPSRFATDGYLSNAQEVLLDYFRGMLGANLRETIQEINLADDTDPYKILCKNILTAKGMDAQAFIFRGIVSQTNNQYALLEYICKHAQQELPELDVQDGRIKRIDAVQIFYDTRSQLHRGLAKNDLDIFRALVEEGNDGSNKVGNAYLTEGKTVVSLQGARAPFGYRGDRLKIVPSEQPGALGPVVLKNVDEILEEAAKLTFQRQQEHPEEIRAEPRVVFGCPARVPRAEHKPNAIKYVHQLAGEVLTYLNEEYKRHEKEI